MTEGDQERSARAATIRTSVAVGVAVGASGIAFGAAGTAAGLSVWQSCALSLFMFTGGSQFALVGVLAAGGPIAAVTTGVASALLLGARNTLYGVRMVSMLGWRGWRRLLGAHLIIDESTAVAIAQRTNRLGRLGFTVTGLAVFICWNIATAAGAIGASVIGDPAAFGLDAAAPAAFLALLAPRLKSGAAQRWLAVAGAAVALAFTPFLPAGVPVLLAALVVVPAVLRAHRRDRAHKSSASPATDNPPHDAGRAKEESAR